MSSCLTGYKRRYATEQAAARHAETLLWFADGCRMRPYRCGCGWWHLTRRGGCPLPAEGVSS